MVCSMELNCPDDRGWEKTGSAVSGESNTYHVTHSTYFTKQPPILTNTDDWRAGASQPSVRTGRLFYIYMYGHCSTQSDWSI